MVGEPTETSGFVALARVLSPATSTSAAVLELDEAWRPVRPASSRTAWTVWGRLPAHGLSAPAAVAFAMRREMALRRLPRGTPGDAVRRLHRLHPAEHGRRPGNPVRRFLLQGAAAELVAGQGPPPMYEDVLAEAEVTTDRMRLAASRDGSVRLAGDVAGRPVIVRFGIAESATDPARNADALRALGNRGTRRVPALLREGRRGGIAWAVESRIPGSNPRSLSTRHWADTIDFLSGLVNDGIPIGAVREQAATLSALLPNQSARLRSMMEPLQAALARLPSAIQHGDFFSDNLLVKGGHLTGVVDWGGWAAAGTPGVDLLELYATDRRRRRPAEFARILTEDVWRSDEFLGLTAGYWRAIGVSPTTNTLNAVASAWWISSITELLVRADRRALVMQPAWVAREVDQVLRWIAAREA